MGERRTYNRREFLYLTLESFLVSYALYKGLIKPGRSEAQEGVSRTSVEPLTVLKISVPAEFIDTSTNQDLLSLLEADPSSLRGTTIIFRPEEVVPLFNEVGSEQIQVLTRLLNMPEYSEKVKIEGTVFSDENRQIFISFALRTIQEIPINDNSLLPIGTQLVVSEEGILTYLKTEQLGIPSQSSLIVMNPELREALVGQYQDDEFSLSFDFVEDGTVILVESMTNNTEAVQLLQIATESERNFHFVELQVNSTANIRSSTDTSNDANIVRPARESGALDIFVTPYQLSLEEARTEFNVAELEQDDQGRFYIVDSINNQLVWYVVQLRDVNKVDEGYGWIRSDVANDPSTVFTIPSISDELVNPVLVEKIAESGEPAIDTIEGAEGSFGLITSIKKIVTQHVVVGSQIELEVFALCEFVGKTNQIEKIAVPLAFNYQNNGTSYVFGLGLSSGRFEGPGLTTIVTNKGYLEGAKINIAFTDVYNGPNGQGVWDINGLYPVIEDLYDPQILQKFVNTEDSEYLPDIGSVEGYRILMPVNVILFPESEQPEPTPVEEVPEGDPAINEVQGTNETYTLGGTIEDFIVLENPVSVGPFEVFTFAIISYSGKSGLQRVAVPLGMNNTNGSSYIQGVGAFEKAGNFEPLAFQNAISKAGFEIGQHSSNAFTDTVDMNAGIFEINYFGPYIPSIYPEHSLDAFVTSEHPKDLPSWGVVNGVPILFTISALATHQASESE